MRLRRKAGYVPEAGSYDKPTTICGPTRRTLSPLSFRLTASNLGTLFVRRCEAMASHGVQLEVMPVGK